MLSFKLDDDFVMSYAHIQPDFGFNGLGQLTYYRTYSRLKEDGKNEEWYGNGAQGSRGCLYDSKKEHIHSNELGWNNKKAQRSAQEMYDRIFKMKFFTSWQNVVGIGYTIFIRKNWAGSVQLCFCFNGRNG